MRMCGTIAKAEAATYMTRLLADTNGKGIPGCFRTDNGGGLTSRAFTDLCDSRKIRQGYTPPDTRQRKTATESAI